MGIPVLILGESGSGKSCSLRNFEKNDVAIYNIAGKPLPFKKHLNKADNVTYSQIKSNMQKGLFKTYVIDDSQYLMAFEMFDRAKEVGYNSIFFTSYRNNRNRKNKGKNIRKNAR